jgi:hypothetical protein
MTGSIFEAILDHVAENHHPGMGACFWMAMTMLLASSNLKLVM